MRQKSACLETSDPRAINLPHPRATNGSETSDAEYDVEHINHPRKLAEDQLVAIADNGPVPRDTKRQGNSEGIQTPESENRTPRLPSKRTELLFQRIKDRNQRYKPLKQKVIKESKHALTLENGSVLRRSGVAEQVSKPAPESPKEFFPKTPTTIDVKRRVEQKKAGAKKAYESGKLNVRAQTRQK